MEFSKSRFVYKKFMETVVYQMQNFCGALRESFKKIPSGITPITEYAGGGMVGIRKPGAIAPTGGPQSGGLPSLYNNVRKR